MLVEQVKQEIKEFIKARNSAAANVLRVALSEASKDGNPTDDSLIKSCKKIIEGNLVSLGYREDEKLRLENTVLTKYIPQIKRADSAKIGEVATEILEEVIDAKSSGQAVGLVAKRLKAAGYEFNSQEVKDTVELMRS
jgi:uncharacterized protein YqeY